MKIAHMLLLTAVFVVMSVVSTHAQNNVIIYSEPGFNPNGFTTKLVDALKDSRIGGKIKTAEQPSLERLDASKQGDIVVMLISTDYRCEGKTHYALTLVFMEIGRDKYNSVQKIYIGSTAGILQANSVDSDVQQYKKLIVDAIGDR